MWWNLMNPDDQLSELQEAEQKIAQQNTSNEKHSIGELMNHYTQHLPGTLSF